MFIVLIYKILSTRVVNVDIDAIYGKIICLNCCGNKLYTEMKNDFQKNK